MRVKVIAPFEIPDLDGDGFLEVEAGINLRQLRRKLKPDRLALRLLPVFVNGERVKGSYKLRPGDLIVFLMPISGGCV